jgi:O-antigen/teichoic acid export membrane protein/anti-anti-sigma regulatory factor
MKIYPHLNAYSFLHGELDFRSAVNGLTRKTKTLQASIVSGSVVLLSGSGLTTAINLVYNIALARFLGPRGFGHATAVYTILTLISAVTLSFQIISAKLVAKQNSSEGKSAVYRVFHRSAWACGVLVAVILLIFQRSIAGYLNLPGSDLVILLGIGAAFYVPLGSRRGYIQGTYGFRRLASNLVLEGAVRLGGSLLLMLSSYGVRGVIAANSAAVAVAYMASAPQLTGKYPTPLRFSSALREISQAMVFFSGQVLINNCDIVLVKHFFLAQEAGLYAAVAMVGRVIFAFSSAVVNTMFPLVAGTPDEERKDLKVIATTLLLVLGTGCLLALGLCIAPSWIWTTLFGSEFEIAGKYNLPYLLALYAITTIVYSLSVVIITFEMSYKIANTSWVQLAFSGVLILSLCRFHSSLHQVIIVQLVLMVALLISVALPFLLDSLTRSKHMPRAGSMQPIKVIRRVSEDEVIAEFLKSDFSSPAFRSYHKTMAAIVSTPNLDDIGENAKRRALLFIRHLALWKELPTETAWYEVELRELELDQVRVFPRAQWRKLAHGNFAITEISAALRTRQHLLDARFLSKIAGIRDQLAEKEPGFCAVILIGVDANTPLTVLDGNHRLAAAMLTTPNSLKKLRFFCGFSPRMTECCWYNTNLLTLFRYGRNVLARTFHNPVTALANVLNEHNVEGASGDASEEAIAHPSCLTTCVDQTSDGAQNPVKDVDMVHPVTNVVVKQWPEALMRDSRLRFLEEMKGCMAVDRPCIIIDCSRAEQLDKGAVHLLLCCLEEAMKRNGDIRLTAVPAGAEKVLALTGVGNLFEIFATNSDALSNVEHLSMETPMHITSYGNPLSASETENSHFATNHSDATSLRGDNDNTKSLD